MSFESIAKEAILRNLYPRLENAEYDAVRVIDYVLARLEMGRSQYGDLDISNDKRDWREEKRQEAADLLVYEAARVISERNTKLDELANESQTLGLYGDS